MIDDVREAIRVLYDNLDKDFDPKTVDQINDALECVKRTFGSTSGDDGIEPGNDVPAIIARVVREVIGEEE